MRLSRAEPHVEVSWSKILNTELLLMCSWHFECPAVAIKVLQCYFPNMSIQNNNYLIIFY